MALSRAGGGAFGSSFSRAANNSCALNESGLGLNCAVHSEDALELDRMGFRGMRNDKADSLLECVKAAGGYGKSGKSFKSSDGNDRSSIAPK